MPTRFLPALTLLALSLLSPLAPAQDQGGEQDLPTLVGRISLTQGDVTLATDGDGDEANPARVNWPLTSRNEITTGRGARTEFRIGSTAVRLDAETSLEITEMGDDRLRLHLHYGSASVRIRNPEVLAGFELTTPNGRVIMREAGRIRVDAGRNEDVTVVSVFEGLAQVDGNGDGLTVRAGRRAELRESGLRTALAANSGFDDWALLRDRSDERVTATRYVDREMTGYEELDQHGMWSDNSEYGPVWMPRSVPSGWAPYRDGRWAYVAPWGWTWVDNASWGYAPSHYGRWVMLNQRWCWAPGRHSGRPAWAPALVGWIGGSNWSLSFGSRHHAPAQGWYPLAPRESYVPHYRHSARLLRRFNENTQKQVNPEWREHRRHGLTVAPHAQFAQRAAIVVGANPRAVVPPLALRNAPVSAPPAPLQSEERRYDREQRGERRFERGNQPQQGNRGNAGYQRGQQQAPGTVNVVPGVRGPGEPAATPVPAAVPYPRPERTDQNAFEERRRRQLQREVQPQPQLEMQREQRDQREQRREQRADPAVQEAPRRDMQREQQFEQQRQQQAGQQRQQQMEQQRQQQMEQQRQQQMEQQ
ncbi:MAG: DUF6600 domain-containing protein, partial [Pseudomonadota bacterium]